MRIVIHYIIIIFLKNKVKRFFQIYAKKGRGIATAEF